MLGILALLLGSISVGLTVLPGMSGGDDGEDKTPETAPELEAFTDEADLVVSADHSHALAEFEDLTPTPEVVDGPLRVDTGDGSDIIVGGTQADIIEAGAGDDLVGGGAGNDRISLDAGNDIYGLNPFLEDYAPEHLAALGQLELGNDTVRGGVGDDVISDQYGANHLVGNQGADILIALDAEDEGDATPDVILGGFGNDQIHADEGDTVYGGRGLDTITLHLPASVGDTPPEPIVIEDFFKNVDTLELDGLDDGSDIGIRDIEDGSGAEVLLDGVVVARVIGGAGLTLDEVLG